MHNFKVCWIFFPCSFREKKMMRSCLTNLVVSGKVLVRCQVMLK